MIRIISSAKDRDKINKILLRSQMDSQEALRRVDEILKEVKENGDKALLKFTQIYDDNGLQELKVTYEEIETAKANIDKCLKNAMKNAIKNITNFHKKQIKEGFIIKENLNIMVGQVVNPIEKSRYSLYPLQPFMLPSYK